MVVPRLVMELRPLLRVVLRELAQVPPAPVRVHILVLSLKPVVQVVQVVVKAKRGNRVLYRDHLRKV